MTQPINPLPKRKSRRWIVRAILVLLLIVILLPIGYWGWGVYQHHLLNQLIAKLHETGEPVLLDDFNRELAGKPSRRAAELDEAEESLRPHPDWLRWLGEDDPNFPLTSREAEKLSEIVRDNEVALKHVQSAMQMSGTIASGFKATSPVLRWNMGDTYQRQRQLTAVVRVAVIDAHARRDDRAALERVAQILMLFRRDLHDPGLVGYLCATTAAASATDALEKITPDLTVGTEQSDATTAQLRSVLAELLDDDEWRSRLLDAIRFERMQELDTILWAVAGEKDPVTGREASPAAPYALTPLAYRDARLLMRTNDEAFRAAEALTWPASMKALPDPTEPTDWDKRLYPFYWILRPAYRGSLLRTEFRCMTSLRMHALALAIRWYAIEHEGKKPATVEELVPTYLPAIPRDPFAADAPLRYRGGSDPIIYSVGENGTDEGGSELATNPEAYSPGRSVNLWDQQDITLHLNRRPREQKDEEGRPAESQPAGASAITPSNLN